MNTIDLNRLVLKGVASAATLFTHADVPTENELKDGAYTKGHIKVKHLNISIENPRGSIRSGKDWMVAMVDHYGYIDGVMGADGDYIDVYVNDMEYLDSVFVIDQMVDGKYDESIVMIGYRDADHAFISYMQNFTADWPSEGHKVFSMSWGDMLAWFSHGDTTKPYSVWMASSIKQLRASSQRLKTTLNME